MKIVIVWMCFIGFMLVHASACSADLIYSIGNSLTWDTKPYDLDGDVDFHVFCNRNLHFIYDNPLGHCVNTSTPWTTALENNSYDFISVQPFEGTTLSQDVAIISEWMTMQPDAVFVIHPAWHVHRVFPRLYEAGNPNNQMQPSPEYIASLTDGLLALHPDREIRSTHTNDMLYDIHLDIENGIGPFQELSDLYRDDIHFGGNTGRYLAHNALRLSMGQSITADGFSMDPKVQKYLNSKLQVYAVPEPDGLHLILFALLMMVSIRIRSRRARKSSRVLSAGCLRPTGHRRERKLAGEHFVEIDMRAII